MKLNLLLGIVILSSSCDKSHESKPVSDVSQPASKEASFDHGKEYRFRSTMMLADAFIVQQCYKKSGLLDYDFRHAKSMVEKEKIGIEFAKQAAILKSKKESIHENAECIRGFASPSPDMLEARSLLVEMQLSLESMLALMSYETEANGNPYVYVLGKINDMEIPVSEFMDAYKRIDLLLPK